MAAEQTPGVFATVQSWDERVMPGRFDQATVIVTGAGAGIGRAVALRIAREGGTVVAVDSNGDRLADLAQQPSASTMVMVDADVSSEQDMQRVVAAAGESIDGLVNNAGIMDDFSPIHEVDDVIWNRVFSVNVMGIMRLSRAVVPIMLDRGRGSIVNVSSEAGFRGSAAGVAYTASKHAVHGITRSCAVMYGHLGIRTNAVAPGATATSIEAHYASEHARQRLEPFMAANVGIPACAEQVAATITFLLSNDGTNVNGAILPSDNGWNAI
jgi:NAD(P)-dependent dehydrogenase (short-subunit alcohol dehydrogenase family)